MSTAQPMNSSDEETCVNDLTSSEVSALDEEPYEELKANIMFKHWEQCAMNKFIVEHVKLRRLK